MSWCCVLINFSLALVLFFLNGWFGNIQQDHADLFKYGKFTFESNISSGFAGNFFQKIINPSVFMAVACAFLQQFSFEAIAYDLWLLVPFYWMLRILFYLLKNMLAFINWKYEIYSFIVSIALGEGTLFLLVRPLIESGESVFLDASEFRDAFWFALIAYLAKIFWDISKCYFSEESVFPHNKRYSIISKRYFRFSRRFGAYVNEAVATRCVFVTQNEEDHFKCLLYAIMIYEDFCRPPVIRGLEYLVRGLRLKREMSLGIMQYKTTEIISNMQSIGLAIDKLFSYYTKESNVYTATASAIGAYNNGEDYYTEVFAIYARIVEICEITYDE